MRSDQKYVNRRVYSIIFGSAKGATSERVKRAAKLWIVMCRASRCAKGAPPKARIIIKLIQFQYNVLKFWADFKKIFLKFEKMPMQKRLEKIFRKFFHAFFKYRMYRKYCGVVSKVLWCGIDTIESAKVSILSNYWYRYFCHDYFLWWINVLLKFTRENIRNVTIQGSFHTFKNVAAVSWRKSPLVSPRAQM